jgi:predicted naringenin-chalcone synthase
MEINLTPVLAAAGRGVIREIEKRLDLAAESVQPAKDTLYHFGNVSSASTW